MNLKVSKFRSCNILNYFHKSSKLFFRWVRLCDCHSRCQHPIKVKTNPQDLQLFYSPFSRWSDGQSNVLIYSCLGLGLLIVLGIGYYKYNNQPKQNNIRQESEEASKWLLNFPISGHQEYQSPLCLTFLHPLAVHLHPTPLSLFQNTVNINQLPAISRMPFDWLWCSLDSYLMFKAWEMYFNILDIYGKFM